MIGILGIHGSREEHAAMLKTLGLKHCFVRLPTDAQHCTGLVLPGGESTATLDLLKSYGLVPTIQNIAARGLPVFGTCAGLICLARLGLLPVKLQRNAYGSQLHSFEEDIPIDGIGAYTGVFIRAPKVTQVGAGVQVLARCAGAPVLMRKKNIWAASFHPELTGDTRVHRKVFLGE